MAVNGLQHKKYETIAYRKIKKLTFYATDLSFRGMHAHLDIELLLILSGSLHVITSSEEFDVGVGEIALFQPNHPHSCYSNYIDPCQALVIQFDPTFCSDYYPALKYVMFSTSAITSLLPGEDLEEMRAVVYDLGYHFLAQKNAFEFRCMGDLNRLIGLFLEHIPYVFLSKEAYESARTFEKRLERILNYIQSHYAEKITLSDIAKREALSVDYLSHFFKDNLHKTFQSYVNELRFERAIFLLKKTNMKIIDICAASGFSDSKYLNKNFLNVYGMTSKEFRKAFPDSDLSAFPQASNPIRQEYSLEKSFEALQKLQSLKSDRICRSKADA